MSPRLLVVADDAALNLALCAHFEDRGWQATGVYDCAAALAATAGTTFERVLLDVQLPDGDGVELLKRQVRLLQRQAHHGADLLHMASRGDLRHNAAEGHVQRNLRVYDVGEHAPPVFHHGRRGLVAGGFNCKDAHMRLLPELLQLLCNCAFIVCHVS